MNNQNLASLVGRVVNVYKGGPEANTGVLLATNDDFFVLQTEEGETIYYAIEHVKSITEDSQERFQSLFNNLDNQVTEEVPKNANELLQKLKNELVQVNRGGPESSVGTLLDVNNDYFTVYSEDDGLIFYNKRHIKSLSVAMTDEDEESDDQNAQASNEEETNTQKLLKLLEHVSAKNFSGLLKNLQYSWVKINQRGPESVEGLLIGSDDNFLLLADKEDLLRLPIFHIKSLSVPVKNEDNSDQAENEEQNNEQSNEQDSSNSENQENRQNNSENNKNNRQNNKNQNNKNQNNKNQNKQDKKQKGNPWDGVTIRFVNNDRKPNNKQNRNSANSRSKR